MLYLCIVVERDKSTLLNLKHHNTTNMKGLKLALVSLDKKENSTSTVKRLINSIEKGNFNYMNVANKGRYHNKPIEIKINRFGWIIKLCDNTITIDRETKLIFIN